MGLASGVRASRIEAIGAGASDARQLRLELLGELRRAVPFTWYAWLLTDPQTGVGCAPLADVPCLPELPALIRLKYQTTVNRWTELTTPWRSASVMSRIAGAVWSGVRCNPGSASSTLHRSSSATSTASGASWTCGATPPPAPSVRATSTIWPNSPRQSPQRSAGAWPRPSPRRPEARPQLGTPVVLLLGPDLTVRAQTPETDRYLRLLVPPEGSSSPVPAGAYTWPPNCSPGRPASMTDPPGPASMPPADAG